MKIIFTDTALNSLEEITDFVRRRWTNKELTILRNDIKKFKQNLNDGIFQHQTLMGFPNLRFTLIGKKQVKLIYEFISEDIIIKLFWHCKQDPKKLIELLNKN
ncbi:type II toxin-antitoxin system RelE/ParE family toxin [Halpernia sp.]|uniref:type II toxin-antitoxin system RelE/ParE family toxin n=1 Tax=Halpernia sp. TaxID=2782209 RepID=UPI003A94C75A